MLGGVSRGNNRQQAIKVFSECYKSLTENGEIWFIENAYGTAIHSLARRLFGAGKNNWSYYTIEDYKEITKNFNSFSYNTNGFLSLFSRKKFKKILTAADSLMLPIIPMNWKYVVCGILKKY